MISAFGVEHEFSKARVPMGIAAQRLKALKPTAKLPDALKPKKRKQFPISRNRS